jgi:two-component system response regulator AtoC
MRQEKRMCEAETTSPETPARRLRAPRSSSGWLRSERTILLIEDDAEMRKLLQLVLTREGYEVVAVADGDQALDWLGLCLFDGSLARIPALIVSDVRLPEFGGLELIEGLLCATADIPVILITGFPSDELYAEAFELGAARVLAKPFDMEALLGAVYTVLEARSVRPSRPRGPGWTRKLA